MMRISLEEVIQRHKNKNPDSDYDYSKTALPSDVNGNMCIRCKIHGIFKQSPKAHMRGQGCPKCAIKKMIQSKTFKVEDFISQGKEKFGNHFMYDVTKMGYVNKKTKCNLYCNIHNLWFKTTPNSHLKGDGCCPKCTADKYRNFVKIVEKEERKKERLLRKLQKEEINSLKEEKKIERQKKQEEKGTYLDENKPKSIEQRLLEKRSCLLQNFIKKAKDMYGDRYDYSHIVEYRDNSTTVPIYCSEKDVFGNEHGIFLQKPNVHLSGHGCPKCGGVHCYTNEEFKDICKKVHHNKYRYDKCNYVNARSSILAYCPEHGYFETNARDHMRGSGCPKCNASKLEINLGAALNENNIINEWQKKFEWLGRQSLDFYLPEYNIGVECQGTPHFEAKEKFGGVDGLKKHKRRDNIKKLLCKENGVNLIYFVPYVYTVYMDDNDEWFTDINDLIMFVKGSKK